MTGWHVMFNRESTELARKEGLFTCNMSTFESQPYYQTHDACNGRTIDLRPVIRKTLEHHQRDTYKLPSIKINERANFWVLADFRRDIMGIGSRRMTTSVSTLGTAIAIMNGFRSMQDDLIDSSQRPLIGLQENIDAITVAIHQATTTAPMIDTIFSNVSIGKSLR